MRWSHFFCCRRIRACAFGVLLCDCVPLLAAVPRPPALRGLRDHVPYRLRNLVAKSPVRAQEEPSSELVLPSVIWPHRPLYFPIDCLPLSFYLKTSFGARGALVAVLCYELAGDDQDTEHDGVLARTRRPSSLAPIEDTTEPIGRVCLLRNGQGYARMPSYWAARVEDQDGNGVR